MSGTNNGKDGAAAVACMHVVVGPPPTVVCRIPFEVAVRMALTWASVLSLAFASQ
jgi:hypothetical protein